jgi:cholesterol transport system auxiliary component
MITCFKRLLLVLPLIFAGCALQSSQVRSVVVYDFGPGLQTSAAPSAANRLPALALEVMESNPALDSTAIFYRLAYVDSQKIQPYALARWSMTPTQLLRQRLRQHFGQRRALLGPGEKLQGSTEAPVLLQLELDEFSHVFEASDRSFGLIRLRATLTQPAPKGAKWLAQRSFVTQREAPSADASGGVQALAAAADAAAQELDLWLQALGQ